MVRIIDLAVAHFRQRTRIADSFGKCHGGGQQVGAGLCDFIEQRRAGQFFGRHRRARDDHVQRHFQAQLARQALRAAGARQDAEFDFRQGHLRAGRGDAVIAAQRQLQPAAHAHAMDGGNHRLGRAFHDIDQGVQSRLREGLGGIEFLDVGAARKGLAGARDDDGLDGVVRQRLADAGHGGGTGGQAQSVDGWIGEGNHSYGTVDLIVGAHCLFLIGLVNSVGVS